MASAGLLVSVATIAAIWALFGLGLNIKFGYTGLLDFGHVAFFLIGAYTTALLVAPPAGTQQFQAYILGLALPDRLAALTGLQLAGGVGWFVALAVGTVAAGLFGLLVALPAIRLREDYLAIALLGISVIVKRTVQTETWLANGPDALRGYPRPLQAVFPLPGYAVADAAVFGLVVFAFWSIAIALLSREPLLDDGFGSNRRWSTVSNAVFAVLTLGFGYASARFARRRRQENGASPLLPVVAGGALAAALGSGLVAFAYFFPASFLLLGTLSVFVWGYAGVVTRRHFAQVTAREWAIALALALGLLVTFLPGRLVNEGPLGTNGLVPVLVLLGLYVAGSVSLLQNWSRFGDGTNRLSFLGVAGVWVFVIRYFLLDTLDSLPDIEQAGGDLLENVLFLVSYQGASIFDGLAFDYSRFLLAIVLGFLTVGYLLAELSVTSPFGRVLKAIREDENVAMALGKNPFAYKVQSMVLGSAIAGLAGGLVAVYYGTLTFRNFDPLFTFFMFLIVVIGGTANNRGVILGAALYWGFVQLSNDAAAALPTGSAAVFSIRVALLGAIFIAILYYRPEGIWGEQSFVQGGTEE